MLKSIAPLMLLATGMLASQTTSLAHDGPDNHFHVLPHDNMRIWTVLDSGSTISGTFVSVREGKAHIRREDGWVRHVKIDRLIAADRLWIESRQLEIVAMNTLPEYVLTGQGGKSASPADDAPAIADSFAPFGKVAKVRWDEDYFYIESNGMPDHKMMVGITAWQQQVPLPQNYTGENAWRIPLHPVPAKNPMSAKDHFFRGAIALAVNGIPIFNPIKNDGKTDTLLAGELDEFGGHCGRADDYHYHIPPVHLEKIVGKGKPLAWALDGYPIYGFQEKGDTDYSPLDKWNGHKDKDGNYHYHATKTYPYLNGGFFGEVVERAGQVDPQPRAEPLRPALRPMRDAKITDFITTKPGSYQLTYNVRGKTGTVSYTLASNGSVAFQFVSPDGSTSKEEYSPNRRGGGNGRRPGPPNNSPPPQGDDRPPLDEKGKKKSEAAKTALNSDATSSKSEPEFDVTSSSLDSKGMLSVACTCDGDRQSPAVAWDNLPQGTKYVAVSLWHTAPDQEKSYWVVYNIPAAVSELKQNSSGAGTLGLNDRRRATYDPMCSKGPGVKKYHITVFALSQEVKLTASKASRTDLLEAVKGITLGETTLHFKYERKSANVE